jgi:hypothetical protein
MTDELPFKVVRSTGTHELLARAVKLFAFVLLDGFVPIHPGQLRNIAKRIAARRVEMLATVRSRLQTAE